MQMKVVLLIRYLCSACVHSSPPTRIYTHTQHTQHTRKHTLNLLLSYLYALHWGGNDSSRHSPFLVLWVMTLSPLKVLLCTCCFPVVIVNVCLRNSHNMYITFTLAQHFGHLMVHNSFSVLLWLGLFVCVYNDPVQLEMYVPAYWKKENFTAHLCSPVSLYNDIHIHIMNIIKPVHLLSLTTGSVSTGKCKCGLQPYQLNGSGSVLMDSLSPAAPHSIKWIP